MDLAPHFFALFPRPMLPFREFTLLRIMPCTCGAEIGPAQADPTGMATQSARSHIFPTKEIRNVWWGRLSIMKPWPWGRVHGASPPTNVPSTPLGYERAMQGPCKGCTRAVQGLCKGCVRAIQGLYKGCTRAV